MTTTHIASNYETYLQAVKSIVASGTLGDFRRNPEYCKILEHVSKEHGAEYVRLIDHLFKELGHGQGFALLMSCLVASNDQNGAPVRYCYEFLNIMPDRGATYSLPIAASPTSLRYLYHSLLIADHIKTVFPQFFADVKAMKAMKCEDGVDIVEVGGGYGGLCYSLLHNAALLGVSIRSYTIIDLEPATQLQRMFHRKMSVLGVEYLAAEKFLSTGRNEYYAKDVFLISNYCYSEIDQNLQRVYRDKLFPAVKHGFMVWNNSVGPNAENLPFDFTAEPERPLTGEHNLFVRF